MTTHNFEITEEFEESPFDFAFKKIEKVLKEKSDTLKEYEKVLKENSNLLKSYLLNETEIEVIFFGLEKICHIPIGMTDKLDIKKIQKYQQIAKRLIQQKNILS